MGLGNLDDVNLKHSGRHFPDHERQDELNDWLEELRHEFPEPVNVDFIEVSPQLTKAWAKAYWDHSSKDRDRYIRLSKRLVENYTDDQIKSVILHELAHCWFYQNGDNDVTERDPIFSYVLGAVGAQVSGYGFDHEIVERHCSRFSDYL